VLAEQKDRRISDNLKLVSFELISREVDDPSSVEMFDRKKQIQKILDAKEYASLPSMKKALEMSNVYLEESSIDFLYI
jgi:hypothetical protein